MGYKVIEKLYQSYFKNLFLYKPPLVVTLFTQLAFVSSSLIRISIQDDQHWFIILSNNSSIRLRGDNNNWKTIENNLNPSGGFC